MATADEIIQGLGITPAPLVRAGAAEVEAFFRLHLHADPLAWLDYLRGIDFHKPVRPTWIPAATELIRHASTAPGRPKPFDYFADRGASPTRLGTTFVMTTFEAYRVPQPVFALVSMAASLSFGLDPRTGRHDSVARAGGARQYILAHRDAASLVRVR